MSGICAVFNRDGAPVSRRLLERMTSSMGHRGQDGRRYWTDGEIGFAHVMHSTTPESIGEEQPLIDDAAGLCIVMDGRIDNGEELRTDLEAHRMNFSGDTDAEIVMRAYQVWGEDCPGHLLGDFAFAIWDRKKRKLFCARDQLGIRPFYYRTDDKTFVCASEMQPIVTTAPSRPKPNLPLIGLYLARFHFDHDETLYAGVYRLPMACSLRVSADRSDAKTQYWNVDPEATIRYDHDSEYGEHFLSLFADAVAKRLRSHSQVGALLSGGLDSSSIVSVSEKLRRERRLEGDAVESFSLVFDEQSCDERNYISEIVKKYGIRVNFIPQERNRDELDLSHYGRFPDVFYAPTLFMNAPALREMKRRGLKVLLDGVGGDELFGSGFEYITDLFLQRKWSKLLAQMRSDSINYLVSYWFLMRNYCIRPSIPEPIRALTRPLRARFHHWYVPPLVRMEFLKSTGAFERLSSKPTVPKFPTRSSQYIYNCLFTGWNATVAKDAVELFNSRFSLETRRPFFDRRLVEFALAIPPEQRWRDGESKYAMRTSMKGILPEKILRRRDKAIFLSVIEREYCKFQADRVWKLFDDSALVSLGAIEVGGVRKVLTNYRKQGGVVLPGIVQTVVGTELLTRTVMGQVPIAA